MSDWALPDEKSPPFAAAGAGVGICAVTGVTGWMAGVMSLDASVAVGSCIWVVSVSELIIWITGCAAERSISVAGLARKRAVLLKIFCFFESLVKRARLVVV